MRARERRAVARRAEEAVKMAVTIGRLAALAGPTADAPLLVLAAELRALEVALSCGADRRDEFDSTPEGKALVEAICERLDRMATTPAVGLAGIAAKAGRVCGALKDHPVVPDGEMPIAASVLADLARLAPEAVGPMP
jgi:hypothetical protein